MESDASLQMNNQEDQIIKTEENNMNYIDQFSTGIYKLQNDLLKAFNAFKEINNRKNKHFKTIFKSNGILHKIKQKFAYRDFTKNLRGLEKNLQKHEKKAVLAASQRHKSKEAEKDYQKVLEDKKKIERLLSIERKKVSLEMNLQIEGTKELEHIYKDIEKELKISQGYQNKLREQASQIIKMVDLLKKKEMTDEALDRLLEQNQNLYKSK